MPLIRDRHGFYIVNRVNLRETTLCCVNHDGIANKLIKSIPSISTLLSWGLGKRPGEKERGRESGLNRNLGQLGHSSDTNSVPFAVTGGVNDK